MPVVHQFWPPGLWGPNLCTPVTSHTPCGSGENGCWLQTFRIFPVERFKRSLYWTIWRTVAVHSCPLSMINAAKLGIRATWFMCCSFRTHFKGAGWSTAIARVQLALVYRESRWGRDTPQKAWLKHSNRVQIALACRHSASGHGVSCIHAARVVANLWCLCALPSLIAVTYCLLLVALCHHSFCTYNAQLARPIMLCIV